MKTLLASHVVRRNVDLWLFAILSLNAVACFRTLDVGKLKCNGDSTCPSGTMCAMEAGKAYGTCVLRRTDAGASSGGASGQSGMGGASGQGGKGGAGGETGAGATDGGGSDIPLVTGASKNGDSCTAGGDCQTGQCVNGVCCENECKDACYACAQLYTSKPDGTCAPVVSGQKDPRGTCVDETASNECGNDGYCNGTGACRKIGTDHVCATASCNGSVFTPTSTCDGKGACKAVVPVDCAAAPCDMVDGCRSSCATDKDCAATSYCNAATKRCAAQKIDGDSCIGSNECSSGFCVDGVCCNKACTDACMACSASLTTAKSGICSAVKVGTDPHDSCALDTTNQCGADGTCDGAGACRKAGTDHVCKAAACSAGTFMHAATCDGKGACGTAASESCGTFTCSDTTGCQKACSADTDCTTQSYCDSTTKTCTTKKDNGKICAAAKECTSNNCVDGMCCNAKCDGLCTSCKNTHTNAADGTCASVSKGMDPYNSCADESATNKCGNTGMCDGAGACQKADKTTSCGTASCSGATFTPASMCDGLGTCKAGSATNCGAYQCSVTTGCLTTCASNSDCSTATYCDTSLAKPVCTPKKGPGEACGTDGSKCGTGRCVDGVCCNTDCTASCYACNVTGSAGTCSTVPAGTADPNGTCKDDNTTCGQDGTCDGKGGCTYAPTSTVCKDASCNPTTAMLTPVAHCDGKGACPAMTATHCDATNLCAADNKSCAGTCTSSSCGTGTYCNGTSCVPKKTSGTCASGVECSSGFCADGVCCNAACTEQCKACNLTGSSGTCTRKTSGSPSSGHGSCTNTDPTCGGSCNGTSDSCYYPSGQSCGTGKTCSSDLSTLNSSACNGSGSCSPTTQSCSTAGQYCNSTTLTCQAKQTSGACSSSAQCASNNCSNGVCCAAGWTGCSGTCANTTSDSSNCGGCGSAYACGANKHCASSACVCNSGTCGSSCITCTGNLVCSGGSCQCPNTNSACGTACTACGQGQTCTGGRCQCAVGYPACGGCLNWDFESGTQGWAVTSTLGGYDSAIDTNVVRQSTQHNVGSSHSLSYHVHFDSGSTSEASVGISVCGTDVSGLRITGSMMAQADPEYSSTPIPTNIVSIASGSQAISQFGMNNSPLGTWVPFSAIFGAGSSLSLLSIDLMFYPVAGNWTGTLYLDDIVIAAP